MYIDNDKRIKIFGKWNTFLFLCLYIGHVVNHQIFQHLKIPILLVRSLILH